MLPYADRDLCNAPRAEAWEKIFRQGELSLGLALPLEAYNAAVPTLGHQLKLAKFADSAGYAAIWARDVPTWDSSFGDAGQVYDPWVMLSILAAHTQHIALATGALILPLRHALHTAKAAATLQHLSGGRFIMGVGSGDRPLEFLAFGKELSTRDEAFRLAMQDIRRAHTGAVVARANEPLASEARVLPRPYDGRLPIIVTGYSQQSLEWIAANADGWLTYPRMPNVQSQVVREWNRAVQAQGSSPKPVAQSLYVDLLEPASVPPTPIHLGLRVGRAGLVEHLLQLRAVGIQHVYFNLRFSTRPVLEVLSELAIEVLPLFHE